jgi:thioredoxin reductase (NADPH)
MGEEGKQEFAQKPKGDEPWEVAIIGSGPAAFTAAIYTTRGAASTIILGGDKWGGQLMLTTTVDNYPGLPGTQGPELMEKMKDHATKFGGEFVAQRVIEVNLEEKPYELKTADKTYYKAKSIIVATGADTRWLEVPGEDELRGKGVSSCAPCDAPFFKEKNVMIVGGGDSTMEEALVLTKYASSVTIIHRRDEFRASKAMQERVFEKERQGKIKILWDTEVVEMIGEEKLEKVKLKTKESSEQAKKIDKERIIEEKNDLFFWEKPTEGLFVAIGHVPATEIFKGKIELDQKGYVKVKDHTKTNVEGVFVAGDVHDYHYRQAITAAGFGCMAAMDLLKYLDKPAPSW